MRTRAPRAWSAAVPFLLLFAVSVPAQAAGFSDVTEGTTYREAIEALQADGVLGGYADRSFRPYRSLNRAEFITLVVTSRGDPLSENCKKLPTKTFSDVPKDAWFAQSVCVAKEKGIIKGYGDGSFGGSRSVTLAEASVVLARVFGEELPESETPWYRSAIAYLIEHGAVPLSLGNLGQTVMRGEFAEMLWRLREGKRDLARPKLDDLLTSKCQQVGDRSIPSADVQEAERMWLQWTNEAREAEGLLAYAMHRQLQRTALLWSRQAQASGTITHKRAGQTSYYDYPRMVSWFEGQDLEFRNDARMTFTENIGYGHYSCRDADCTDDLVGSIRSTFDFFMSEKGKEYRPHYNSIMNGKFKEVGVGIVVGPGTGRYYITVHYGTEIVSNPAPVCL